MHPARWVAAFCQGYFGGQPFRVKITADDFGTPGEAEPAIGTGTLMAYVPKFIIAEVENASGLSGVLFEQICRPFGPAIDLFDGFVIIRITTKGNQGFRGFFFLCRDGKVCQTCMAVWVAPRYK